MFANRPANSAGLLRLLFACSFYWLFYCLLVNSCVHCNVPKPSAYFNQTILIHRGSANDSATVGQFKLTPKLTPRKTFKGSLLTDASTIEPLALVASLATKPIDAAGVPLAKPFLGDPKSTSLIEPSTTSLSVLAAQDDVRQPQPAKAAASRKFHADSLPKAEARVQQPQHTRSRTGSTTIDLSENKFGKPSIQYLNQSRPSTATYVTKNNEMLTVRTPVSKQANKVTDLHIGALFPMTSSHSSGWLGGQGCKPAIGMALKDVNNSPNLLPGYHLVLHHNDSKCDPGLGTTVLYDLIYEPPIKLLILGGCSIVCSTIAETAKLYNLVVVGYGSSSPALSNRERFPTFFRTHPSATIHNPTRIKLFNKFGWKKIAVILEAEEVFISTGIDLEVQCKNAGIEIITRVSFLTDPKDAVKSLARQDARIIIGMFYGGAARKVMCEAYKQGLYGKQYVWFLIGWYEDDWYRQGSSEINCTIDEMSKAVEGHLTTEALILNRDGRNTIAGLTAERWQRKYEQVLKQSIGDYDKNRRPEGYLEAPLAYDAIWAIALALNKTLPKLEEKGILIESFDYQNGTVIKDEIINSLKQIQFLGVSGEVAFSERGDRIALTQIEQMIEGKYNLLGYYDTQTDNLTWFNLERWVGDRPPPDHTQIVEKLIIVSTSFFVTANVLSVVGIVWAIGLLCFNYKFRNFRYIQASLPVTNNIMLFGFIISLSSIMLFGLDSQKVDESYFPLICHGRALFLSIGFSLSYGAMFVKIWLSYRLSTHMEHSIKKKDFEIYLTILAFCVIDLCILITWYLHSPMERKVEKFDLIDPEGTDEDIKIEPQLEICDANIVWYSLLFGFKGLLLIFGLFLAYETRSVKLKQINDSKLINMSIYNVVVLCMITGPVSLVITNQVNGHFAFITFTIICCCFLTMILVFVPKIVELVRRRGAQMAFGSNTNGTFHDNLSVQEQQEKFQKLTQENDELMSKISEKDSQIEEIRKQIEEITKIRRNASQKTNKKAVRIREPDEEEFEELNPPEEEEEITAVNETTTVLESKESTSSTNPATSPNKKDLELYESYL